jgi:hypothetical protein
MAFINGQFRRIGSLRDQALPRPGQHDETVISSAATFDLLAHELEQPEEQCAAWMSDS